MTTTPSGFPMGNCATCGRLKRLKNDGTMGVHNGDQKDFAGFRKRCAGSGQPARQDAGEATA